MTPKQAEVVERVRRQSAEARSRAGRRGAARSHGYDIPEQLLHGYAPAETRLMSRTRVAARYVQMTGCTPYAAAQIFATSAGGVTQAIARAVKRDAARQSLQSP